MKIHQIPIFDDNYQYLIENSAGEALIVDPGDADACLRCLEENGLKLRGILMTHYHPDHAGGLAKVLSKNPTVPVIDSRADEELEIAGLLFQKINTPGHTLDHCIYFLKNYNKLFSGDLVFGLGCGRIFEGTFQEAFDSLRVLRTLPVETEIFCSHEYTETNLQFAYSLLKKTPELYPLNSLERATFERYEKNVLSQRRFSLPTVPLHLSEELKVNPFLKCPSVEAFENLRLMRNRF